MTPTYSIYLKAAVGIFLKRAFNLYHCFRSFSAFRAFVRREVGKVGVRMKTKEAASCAEIFTEQKEIKHVVCLEQFWGYLRIKIRVSQTLEYHLRLLQAIHAKIGMYPDV
jgi:hypothetical protein